MRKVGLCAVAISLAMSSLSDTWTDSTTGIEWSYTLSNGVATITGATPAKGVFTIPQMINESAVVDIGANAFKDCGDITSVVLPSGLLGIGEYAFYGCKKITYLDIPDGCATLGSYAFGHAGIQRMRIPVSMNNLGGNIFPGTFLANAYTIDWIVSGNVIRLKEVISRITGSVIESTFGSSCGGVLVAYAEAAPPEAFSTITDWGMFAHKYYCKSAYYQQWADCFGAENFLGYLDDDFQNGKSAVLQNRARA